MTGVQFHAWLWSGAELMLPPVPTNQLCHLLQWMQLQCWATFSRNSDSPKLRCQFKNCYGHGPTYFLVTKFSPKLNLGWRLEGMMDIADTFDVQKLVSHLGCHYHGSPQSRRRKSWKLWLQRQVDRSMYWIQWDLLHPNAE